MDWPTTDQQQSSTTISSRSSSSQPPGIGPLLGLGDQQQAAEYSLVMLFPSAAAHSTTMARPMAADEPGPEILFYGFLLVLIPTATILGNMLVIVSVLRFKALQSAINFLILGLAVADLMVALFVMPYAVYVYVQGGFWLLGPLMCNLYLSSDVACSTASISLLALISFDRYQAISHPIQYSRQAQNIARVVKLFVGVWVYSFIVASPIVLGFNDPPASNSSPFECRFYNPYFSLLSSLVSFVLPCFIVIFVYLRIIAALHRREKAAKLRKAQQMHAASHHGGAGDKSVPVTDTGGSEAGEIVAGPAVNMMMIALPSLNRQIKRYERHKRALEEVEAAEAAAADGEDVEDDLSSSESLSEDMRILTNDFLSEVPTNSNSRNSHSCAEPLPPPPTSLVARGSFLLRGFRASFSAAIVAADSNVKRGSRRKKSLPAEAVVPSIFGSSSAKTLSSSGSRRGYYGSTGGADNWFGAEDARKKSLSARPIRGWSSREENRLMPLKEEERRREEDSHFSLEKQSKTTIGQQVQQHLKKPQGGQRVHQPCRGALSFPLVRRIKLDRHIGAKHYNLTANGEREEDGEQRQTFLNIEGKDGERRKDSLGGEQGGQEGKKVVVLANGRVQNGKVPSGIRVPLARDQHSGLTAPSPFRRGASAVDLLPSNRKGEAGEERETEESTLVCCASHEQQENIKSTREKGEELPSGGWGESDGRQQQHEQQWKTLQRSQSSRRGRDKHASLRRKVHKSHRKEKRATKTLGIVVGTFLCCWVPFFSLNIMNALCVEFGVSWCQVGFGPFFYTTWIGYMNSFMNPVIYTIFNAEFRRAFKSLLLGRRAVNSGTRRIC